MTLEDLQAHLGTLRKRDWDRLFDLLPAIESKDKFGEVKGGEKNKDGSITIPFYAPDEIVFKTFRVVHELDIVPVFDWTSWRVGQDILENKDFDYNGLDMVSLCKLLTVIIRTDRFCDGYLVSCFDRGIITRIIKGMKLHLD